MPDQGSSALTKPELLKIREAASLLHVSEVSLRRWTNDGKLPCFRVGGRKERRFKRADLEAFLNRDAGRDAIIQPENKVMIEDIAIKRGAHLCSFYKSDLGRLKMSVAFLASGLRAQECCFLIASQKAEHYILEHLRAVFPDLDAALQSDQLVLSNGAPSGDEMYQGLEQGFTRALSRGFSAMRLVGDMAWSLEQGVSGDERMAFEQRYNPALAHRFPIVSLCLYDCRLFSGAGIHEALVCHEDTFTYPLSRFV